MHYSLKNMFSSTVFFSLFPVSEGFIKILSYEELLHAKRDRVENNKNEISEKTEEIRKYKFVVTKYSWDVK